MTVLIDGGTVAMGVAGLALFAPPIGGTIATGSFCIRDIVLLMGGTVTIGECLGITAFAGSTTGATWAWDGLPCKSTGEVVLSKPPWEREVSLGHPVVPCDAVTETLEV